MTDDRPDPAPPPDESGRLARPDGAGLRWGLWHPPRSPARGSVLLLTGRSEFLEKYAETAADLRARGFRTLCFDWRGQGLSTRDPEGDTTGHVEDFDPFVADAAAMLDMLLGRDPGPVIVLGHSMGGGLALRLLAVRPGAVRAAILTAPMVDPIAGAARRAAARIVAPLMAARGRGRRHPPGEDWRLDEAYLSRADPRLTGDPRRGMVQRDWIRRNPALGVRGVTWGWLAAAFAMGAAIRREAPGITTPTLFVLAGREALVDNPAAAAVAAAMPRATVLNYPVSGHEILMETDAIRTVFWRDVDDFLGRLGL